MRVPAVGRISAVLDALAASENPRSLKELTDVLGLSKSSVHDTLTSLADAGVIDRLPGSRYRIGVKVLAWSRAFLESMSIVTEFSRIVDVVFPKRQHTVVLAVRDNLDVVYLGCRHGSSPLAVRYEPGLRLSAARTATGKALLCTLSDDVVRSMYTGHTLEKGTPRSIDRIDELLKHLAKARSSGFALDMEETAESMCCVGAPVFRAGEASGVAAVAAIVVPHRSEDPIDDTIIRSVIELADALTTQLGGTTEKLKGGVN